MLLKTNLFFTPMNHINYKDCIDACLQCAILCQQCAAEDLKEEHDMRDCIQLNMECAVICFAAAQLMSLKSAQALALCKLCAEICRKCAGECGKYAYQHCLKCAEACHRCSELCSAM